MAASLVRWVVAAGLAVVGAFLVHARLALSNDDFVMCAAFLLCLLAAAALDPQPPLSSPSSTSPRHHERFAQSDAAAANAADAGAASLLDLKDLLALPARVRDALMPSLDRLKTALKGEAPKQEQDAGGEDPNGDQAQELMGRALYEGTPDAALGDEAFKQLQRDYKGADYALCMLRGTEPALYGAVMRLLRGEGGGQ